MLSCPAEYSSITFNIYTLHAGRIVHGSPRPPDTAISLGLHPYQGADVQEMEDTLAGSALIGRARTRSKSTAASIAWRSIGAYRLASSVSERPFSASVANTAVGTLVSLTTGWPPMTSRLISTYWLNSRGTRIDPFSSCSRRIGNNSPDILVSTFCPNWVAAVVSHSSSRSAKILLPTMYT